MRASTPNPSRRTIIHVASFNEEMDEKGSETDVSRGGSVGKDGVDGAVVPETILNSPLATIRIGIMSAEE